MKREHGSGGGREGQRGKEGEGMGGGVGMEEGMRRKGGKCQDRGRGEAMKIAGGRG